MNRPIALALKKDLSRTLRQGHPWVFREALAHRPGIAPGEIVAVTDKQGREVAFGFWDAHGPIAVRVLDLVPVEDPAALVRRRLQAALAMRRARLDLTKTSAFRWVHGEADRLPGIHVDVYADVASVRYDGEGSRVFFAGLPDLLSTCAADFPVRKVIDRDARSQHSEEIEITENGVRFIVDLGRGQKGGLFLDQRDNRLAIAEAHALGAPLIVLVCGAVPGQPLTDSRQQILDGIAALLPDCQAAGVKLAIEPLHPMYADSRSAVNTLGQANDMVVALKSPLVGVAADVYHIWWDQALEQEISRSGRLKALFAFHVCDWRTPTMDLLNDRGLMGEGCIPLRHIRAWVEAAGFQGFNEVEVFSTRLWAMDQEDYLKKIIQAYREHV